VPWYGIGLDYFGFDANVSRQTVDTTIFGATAPATLQPIDFSVSALAVDLVRLRYRFLAGRFQPYLTAGPAFFRVKVTNKGNGELTTDTATDSVTGYKIAGGLSLQIAKGVAIFGEFRYTHFRAEPVLQGTITGAHVPLKFDLDTRHLLAGLSFRF
jgi:opacity protein-like surface antigen